MNSLITSFVVFLLAASQNCLSAAQSYKIGFLVPAGDCCIRHVIEYALSAAPVGYSNDTVNLTLTFEPVIMELTRNDNSYTLGQKVCEMLERNRLLAIFNMDGRLNDGFLNSLSYNLETPYIKVAKDESYLPDTGEDATITFHPMVDVTLYTVMQQFGWSHIVLVYKGQAGYIRMVKLSKLLFAGRMNVKLMEVSTEGDMHGMFKLCKEMGCSEYAVDLSLVYTEIFLRVALMEGLISEKYSYILLNLDAHLLDLSPYQHNAVNITALSLLADTADNAVILQDMTEYFTERGRRHITDSLSALSILTFDAVQTFRRAVQAVSYGNNMELNRVTCDNGMTMELGHTIFNYLGSTIWSGLSGSVRLERGNRKDYSINILQLVEHLGLRKLAEYTIVDGAYKQVETPLPRKRLNKSKSLRVTAIIEEPFLMLSSNHEKLKGNKKYIGFCADLLARIAQELGFTYEISVCENCTYGAPDDNGVWDGMVGELIDQKADLALGSFTINYKREQIIDLTKPFMHVGISILYKVPKKETPGLFSFMEPLAIETWFYVILAYVLVSVSMFVLGRFSPQEHVKKTVRNGEGQEVVVKEFRLSLADGFWFAVGSEVAPLAMSTRTVGGFWWLFSLFVIASYTANLAAFLTVEKTVTPIKNADDLSLQREIDYGTLVNGSTWLFFKESNIEPYRRMWQYMSANPHVFVNSYDEGVERVKNGGYALLMESATLDYKVQKNCEILMQIGGLLDSKGYGIGTQRDSPWRDLMSGAILKIQESGEINEMYEDWWKRQGACNKDSTKTDPEGPNALDLENVGGIFIILIIGLAISFVVAVLENVYRRKSARRKGSTHQTFGGTGEFFRPCCIGHGKQNYERNKRKEVSGSLGNTQSESSCEGTPTEKDADSSDSLITTKQKKNSIPSGDRNGMSHRRPSNIGCK